MPEPDILVTNAGGPPPGVWSDWSRDDFLKAIDVNMLTPIALMQAVLPGMIARGWGRVVNITSGAVKSPIPALGLSNTARTGLTGFVAGTSRQVAPHGVTINNLLPGIHDTDRAEALDAGGDEGRGHRPRGRARAGARRRSRPGRYGTPEEFGAACAFLCSVARGLHRRAEHPRRRRGVQQHPLDGGFPWYRPMAPSSGRRRASAATNRSRRVGGGAPLREAIARNPIGRDLESVARACRDCSGRRQYAIKSAMRTPPCGSHPRQVRGRRRQPWAAATTSPM